MIYDCAEHDNGRLREMYPNELTAVECQEILSLMEENNLARLLERGLPDGVVMAHKVGWIDDTHGNIGIVFGPERDYLVALALYSPGWLEWEISAPLFEAVSRLAYAHFNDPDAYPAALLAAPPDIPHTNGRAHPGISASHRLWHIRRRPHPARHPWRRRSGCITGRRRGQPAGYRAATTGRPHMAACTHASR
ncbi:MAG: serine hydrolase [Chloroflexi bacterium]|nr:serine hydrolase [Chloroflexota bacterium]